MTLGDTLLHDVLTGQRQPTPQFVGPQEALIAVADATTGTTTFVIPALDRQAAYGPAPFPRPSTSAGAPPAGTRCLVTFVGPDADGDYSPWVLVVAGWPA